MVYMNNIIIPVSSIPDAFFVDVAVGVKEFPEICQIYNIDEQTAELLEDDPEFKRRLLVAEQAVTDDGRAFKARCRTAVNTTIGVVMNMMGDPDIPASVQLDAFKTLAKFGELEPAPKQANALASGPTLTLNIIAPTGETHRVIDIQTTQPDDNDPPWLHTHPLESQMFNAA